MPPRLYQPDRQLPPAKVRSLPTGSRAIPHDAKLYDLKPASTLLTEQFGAGFTVGALRKYIRSSWQEGWHYRKVGKFYKLYLPAVQEWAIKGKSV